MSNNIVNSNVNIITGAAPSKLQKSGAVISQGATTASSGSLTLISAMADLTAILAVSGSDELHDYGVTYFKQGSTTPFYVLELGSDGTPTASEGVTALTAWIAANPGVIYSYTVPRAWTTDSSFVAYAKTFNTATSRTYFFVTTGTSGYAAAATAFAGTKSVFLLCENSSVGTDEVTISAPHYVTLRYTPSGTNRVTPLCFSFLNNVTNIPVRGNASMLNTLKADYINYVDTGAEGGITNLVLKWGTMMDGKDFNYWYSVDWMQINGDQAVAYAVIQGSNNPANPLIYDQNGIDRLQDVLAVKAGQGQSYGLVLGDVVKTTLDAQALQEAIDRGDYDNKTIVNAIPFRTYCVANPTHYSLGQYDGLSVTYIPATGFKSITYNINVTQLVTA